MDDQNKNLLLATGLSFVVLLIWMAFFAPEPPAQDPNLAQETVQTANSGVSLPAAEAPTTTATVAPTTQPADDTASAPRIPVDTARLEGSISLLGGRIDDLRLKDYREDLSEGSDIVTLLSPVGTSGAYYALHGWANGTGLEAADVPGLRTLWSIESGDNLTVETPVTLRWDSPAGLTFRKTISVDEDFMFTVSQSVENTAAAAVRLAPYGLIARHGTPSDLKNFFILHEGLIRMTDGELGEVDYDDVADLELGEANTSNSASLDVAENGWIGFTDHYWMTTLVPQPGTAFKSTATYNPQSDIYQAVALKPTLDLPAGGSLEASSQFFAGAKEWEAIRTYQNASGIDRFLDSIDWGWFFFLTKPIFAVLHWLNAFIGNMGWAIIGLTLIIKAILLPLAYKSYVSMAKMKELQPEMEKLKEAAGDDREKMQRGMMELYKKNKVNPAGGCLPILLQIPIFFALYKVIFVTLELRHAPWFGPFADLSAPDPTSIMNLFGLLPFAAPAPESILGLIFLGILPLILGVSMWLQQKLNPAPTDPTQAMIFAWMPWVFMFMLGTFASGLIVYWIANNVLTFTQQYLIMRSQGVKPDIFGNIKAGFKKSSKADS
ncbi:membrane protein insertase YidC [Shimia ponticola]|uniref:membrane protein insertase YidC n=1 Tax=Shimia ponticola TaxID=2582893 RepID=UPI0011BD4BC0|nr:membrane protein insertase YidC [Shimia ponticola]